MARPKVPTINWKKELRVLDSYINCSGGVVLVRTTKDSPSSAFCKAIRSIMENELWDKQWVTVQIDGDNSSTHYFSDMLDQLEITLNLESKTDDTSVNVSVGNDISADGNVEINDISINIDARNNNYRGRIERIVNYVKHDAGKKRLAVILFNTDSEDTNKNELNKFKNFLWDNGLSNLTHEGVLLIGFSHRCSDTSRWLPDPDIVIDLPSSYDHESEINAKEDIANFLLSHGWAKTKEEAAGKAMGIVASHPYPKDLHANFAGILARFSAWQ
ncbi:hypothetical protein SAMN05660860_00270 [Geoalkalibacter ferrihydriticus]|uniref:Uncharacterized protein n=2 Tax=Geoalkalibacter ferrihydriticus TaxID=392333 RepID=A0A0C2HKR0_9BACT|nr:hypothetical protein [Geoalkalibacter ferrihydriticus]KIH75600.1 hypothetical protein GFER_15790 [Geoalkalibacter ferrihydriticus DSM 17813]SDL29831.1 hypothetical protein SAMN05660860_00270 [Geoalkalibacter ferrihydriticus]